MNLGQRSALALALAAAGLVALAYAATLGQVRVVWFLVFPLVVGTGLWPLVGVALLVAAAFTFFAGSAMPTGTGDAPQGAKTERRSGGVILLGPIPIAWGSDRKVARTMLWIGVAVALGIAILWIAW